MIPGNIPWLGGQCGPGRLCLRQQMYVSRRGCSCAEAMPYPASELVRAVLKVYLAARTFMFHPNDLPSEITWCAQTQMWIWVPGEQHQKPSSGAQVKAKECRSDNTIGTGEVSGRNETKSRTNARTSHACRPTSCI